MHHTHTHTHLHTHTHTHTYIDTHIHAHAHIHTCSLSALIRHSRDPFTKSLQAERVPGQHPNVTAVRGKEKN